MPKFVHIDISASDPERAAQFYRRAFGWAVTKLEGPMPYWLVAVDPDDPNAIGAGIGQRTEPWQSTVPTIDVCGVGRQRCGSNRSGGRVHHDTEDGHSRSGSARYLQRYRGQRHGRARTGGQAGGPCKRFTYLMNGLASAAGAGSSR